MGGGWGVGGVINKELVIGDQITWVGEGGADRLKVTFIIIIYMQILILFKNFLLISSAVV